ncbi:MAG: glycoside hydrolase family 127 protein [Alphaproteobacteria bacterium]|nr:glycoside hydrolase family 127 protein [Alphaproteobacteria bacterium]
MTPFADLCTSVISRRRLLQSASGAALMAASTPAITASPATPRVRAKSFPLESVRLLPSPYRTAMEADLNYLHLLEPDRLLHNYRIQAGLPPKGEAYGGWESESISGHTLGHYLSACSHMHAQTGDDECRKKVVSIVDELVLCQAQSPDGYVAGFTRKKDDKTEYGKVVFEEIRRGEIQSSGFDLNGAWSPLYNWHKLLAGLLDADRHCGAGKAVTVAERLGGYIEGVFATLKPVQIQTVLACEYGGINESFAELYARTGNRRWLRLSETIYDQKVLDPLTLRHDDIAYLHSNTQIPKVVGLARLYELTGDERYGVASSFFWSNVTERYTYVIGGNGDREYFQAPMTISKHITEQTCETCSSYNMLKLTRHLYARQPSAAYFDYFERTHLNHILAQQNPQTGMFAYMTPLMSGTHRNYSTPFDDFWCCVGTGMESHAKHGESIYWHTRDTLLVNLYIPSTLDWTAQKTMLELTTNYPFADTIQLKFTARDCHSPLTLALRVPSWCTEPALQINSQVVDIRVDAGYLHVRRAWKAGDVLSLTLPRRLRLEPTLDDETTVAMLYGPLVMAGDLGPATGEWNGTAPVFVGEQLLESVAPANELGQAAFRTSGVVRPSDLTVKPFAFQHERNTAIYFRRFTQAGWVEEQARYQAEQEQLKDLAARSSDVIYLGEMQAEHDHDLRSKNSYPVVYRGKHGRDARAGGYFEFIMKTQPGPLVLAATYWGEERNRRFKILVDGIVIGRDELNGEHPSKFFERDYPVPAALTAGRNSITVRFEPETGASAGPAFGVRLFCPKTDSAE